MKLTDAANQLVQQSEQCLSLSGTLDANTVIALERHPLFLCAIQEKECAIDLSAVEAITSAGIALLIEWLAIAKKQAATLHFLNMPEQVRAMIQLSDLEIIFAEAIH